MQSAPFPANTKRAPHRPMRAAKAVLVVCALLLFWGALDFFIPRADSIRDFDPHAVASLETEMWRSYYDHRRVALFVQLTSLLRTQYHLSWTRSCVAAYHAARAAVVFQRGKERPDYTLALPDIVDYYNLVHAGSDTRFDVGRASQLELEWWIVHRQRARHAPQDLPEALAALQAAIYSKPEDRFREHGQKRADAMLIRDSRAESGGVSDSDWRRINLLLDQAWVSAWSSIHRNL